MINIVMLSPGTRLGPYEILSPIGAGGMGEVYRATDSRLHREVAIKVSAAQFSERFEREARAVAALNHPNICTLHDVGPNYLVMELIEGPTLADRIRQGPVPLDEALAIARQIADALEAAHEKGVVHRDLKPANVKIKPDGMVKVLDFGLAKVTEDSTSAGSPENSPTLSLAMATRAGVILGTAAYMAPEQARGKPVDKRADIWAFGVVLYEMLTGQRFCEGETVSDTLAAVLTREPEWERVPATVRRLLRSCLEKDPKRRLRDIGDVWKLLDEAPAAGPATVRRAPRLAWSASAAFLLIAALVSFLHFREKPPVAERVQFQMSLPAGAGQFELSPDGRWLAFVVSGAQGLALWVRALDALEPHPVPGAAGLDRPFFWSADSRFIAFPSAGKLKKVDISGGLPQTVRDIESRSGGIGGAWNRDGTILFGGDASGIMRVSASGGVATPLTSPHREPHNIDVFPSFLPDGRHFLYLRAPVNPGILLGSLDVKPEQQGSKRLLATMFSPVYVPTPDPARGYLLFLRQGALMAQSFNARRLEPDGEPVAIAEKVGTFLLYGFFSASANGVLAYRSGVPLALSRPTWFDRGGKALGPAGEPASYLSLALAPDGTRVATVRIDAMGDAVGQDLWLLELARGGAPTRFTFGPGPALSPVWSSDGTRIVFHSVGGGGLYRKAASGAGEPELMLKSASLTVPDDWSRDGRFLLYSVIDPKTGYDLWVLPDPGGAPGDRKPTPFLQTRFNERYGQFSPDSRWIAYVSDESGRPEVYVQPFPASASGGTKTKISDEGGSEPRWRRDGKELFYLSPDRKLMAVDVAADGAALRAGSPKLLFQAPAFSTMVGQDVDAFRWDVSADGKRFLLNTAETPGVSEPVTVVLNWTAGLKK